MVTPRREGRVEPEGCTQGLLVPRSNGSETLRRSKPASSSETLVGVYTSFAVSRESTHLLFHQSGLHRDPCTRYNSPNGSDYDVPGT